MKTFDTICVGCFVFVGTVFVIGVGGFLALSFFSMALG